MSYAVLIAEGKTLLFLLPLSDKASMVGPCLFLWIDRIIRISPSKPFALSAGGFTMGTELDPKELVDFREMVMANTIQVDTMYKLLIQKGYFTEAEFLEKMKEVQTLYMKGENSPSN